MKDDRADQCVLKFFDLQERVLPVVRLSDNFTICTWKVRATFAFCTNPVRNDNNCSLLSTELTEWWTLRWGVLAGRKGLFEGNMRIFQRTFLRGGAEGVVGSIPFS